MVVRCREYFAWCRVGLVVAVGLYGALLGGCVGISPPRIVGPMRLPIPWQAVRLYSTEQPPVRYQVIAHLNATGYGLNSSRKESVYILNRLRRQAAGLGANGLLLKRLVPPGRKFAENEMGSAWRIWAIYVPSPARGED